MPDISITVADKIAHAAGSPVIVCGNSDYVINFTLDSEWDSYDIKTARFEYAADGELKYQDVVFSGLSVSAPIITRAAFVEIGLYAGDLHTTTPARVPCRRSILCGSPTHADPPPDVYNQLLELIAKAGSAGNPTGLALGYTNSQMLKTVAGTATKIEEE